MITKKTKQFKYPIGKCKALHRDKEGRLYDLKDQPESELIGYSFFNTQIIDTETNTVWPTEEKEKVPTCLDCYLYEKPMMENRMAEEKIRHPEIIPYQWFWFYHEEDEKRYPNNWRRRYEKLLAKEEVWKKYKGQKDLNAIKDTPEWQQWLKDYKDCLSWNEEPR